MCEVFELKPRFKGCPPICLHANLPAFDSPKAAAEFVRNPILIKWFCTVCYHWHAWFKSPAPAGGSSGTSREERIPEHIARLAKGE